MSVDEMNAAAGVQQAAKAMDMARRAVSAMEEDYAYWMGLYKQQTRDAAEWATERGNEATEPSPPQRALENTKHGMDCASRSLSEARQELVSAREELHNARDFFMQLARLAATVGDGDKERPRGNNRAAIAERRRQLIPGTTMPSATPISARIVMAAAPAQERSLSTASTQSPATDAATPTSVASVQIAAPNASDVVQADEADLRPLEAQQAPPAKRQRSETLRMSMPAKRTRYARNFLWECDGEMHHFPEDFAIPHCTLSRAWELWCSGDSRLMYPPFRILLTRDLPGRPHKKLYSEYRFAMIWIEEEVRQLGAWVEEDHPSFETVTDMLDRVKGAISEMRTNGGRNKQPIECLQWTTATSLLRKRAKLDKQAATAPPQA